MKECKKPCADDQICNKETGKCVSKTGRIGKKILGGKAKGKQSIRKKTREGSESPDILKRFNPVSASSDEEYIPDTDDSKDKAAGGCPPCPDDKICNPETGKCVLKSGRKGKEILANKPKKAVAVKKCSPPCPDDKICNPETGKCVLKSGRKGKELMKKTGKKEEEDEEDEEEEDEEDIDPKDIFPLIKMNPSDIKSKCVLDSVTKLVEPQALAAEYFNTHDSLLVVFDTGVGKTLTAITIGECYLKQHPTHKIVVITTKTLLKNFNKEFTKYGPNVDASKYKVYTYQTVMNMHKKKKPVDCNNTLLIIDEVHNLRNYEGKTFDAAMDCAMKASKVLLLTATPYVNNICDIISLINLINKSYIVRPRVRSVSERFKQTGAQIWKARTIKYTIRHCGISVNNLKRSQAETQLHSIKSLLQGRVAYAEKAGSNYPETKFHDIMIPMSKEYEELFEETLEDKSVFGAPEKFANGYRRAVNKLGEDNYVNGKMKQVIKIIKSDKSPYARNIIFSSWLKFGTSFLSKILKHHKITFAIISGETKGSERLKIVDDYNNGEINTLIITMAGSTGIDLKGVQNIIILDPVWNPATLDQIVGRGVRYRSHVHLPPERRIVNVYRLLYVEKSFLDGTTRVSKSGDYILYRIIEKKIKYRDAVTAAIRTISIF